MATVKKSRGAQYALHADFLINIGTDTMIAAGGTALVAFNAAGTAAYDVIPLPPGATVIGGELVVETVDNATGAATLSIGDSLNAARYLAATSLKAAARTPVVPTGFRGNGEDIRITITSADATATAGVATVRISYMIANRVNEVNPT